MVEKQNKLDRLRQEQASSPTENNTRKLSRDLNFFPNFQFLAEKRGLSKKMQMFARFSVNHGILIKTFFPLEG